MVHLPGSATIDEISIACALLAEIVRLRRANVEKHDQQQQLTYLALTDPLTGLANRRGWQERATQILSLRGNWPSCLVLIDLDHFKEVNTQFGMVAGDACLREVAQRLSAAVRKDDLVARLGGDELALLLPSVDPAAAPLLIDRVRASIGRWPLQCLPHVTVTASAGWVATTTCEPRLLAEAEEIPDYLGNLLEQADSALRAAKAAGRNRTIAA
jgi:diguanylate cyclase (GGDEF)-like protein